MFYQSGLITETEGQRAFPSLTAQKTASFSLGFRPKSHAVLLKESGDSVPRTPGSFRFRLAPDRGRESASSPSLRTGQALFTHPALQLMGSNSETEVFEF